MSVNHKDYLAANVLSEGKIVNYRLLSHVLGVHVNVAKQYLYDFYQTQRARKPDSVHATYLLSGRRCYEERPKPAPTHNQSNGQINGGQDNVPASSPFPSSVPQQEEDGKAEFDLTVISIVKEEDLEEAKARLTEINALHIYSLESAPFQNLQTLSDCNREISLTLAEDGVNADQFGVISNPLVKKRKIRTNHAQSDIRSTHNSDLRTKVEQPEGDLNTSTQNVQSKGPAGSQLQGRDSSSQPKKAVISRKSDAKPPNMKRDNSDLFKSFAKAKTKSKDVKRPASETPSVTHESTEQSASEDETMLDTFEASEEESSASEQESAIDVRDGQAERQSKLQKMMEDDDEPTDEKEKIENELDLTEPKENDKSPGEQNDDHMEVTVTGGRRRGRRRVMKKKTLKDDEGYLVTKEELIWESFSEEEPERKVVSSASSTQNSKKSGSKPGQGKIMSFFSKK